MQNVLLGVCGSVAAYKAALVVRAFVAQDFSVQVMATPAALQFVGAPTFRALSGKSVAADEWCAPISPDGMDHIALARTADCLLVAPASADFIAHAANGFADNVLLSAFLAADCPRFLAPAMNQQMWRAAVTQRNLQVLANDGVRVLQPDSGEQACGEVGPGRMMEVAAIVAQVSDFLAAQHLCGQRLRGRRVVVNTGATVEYIDDMRVISNMSSGKMGFCIAEAAAAAGADVRIIAGNTTAPPPLLPLRRALSNQQMHAALLEECQNADIFIAAAAIADYAPQQQTAGKIPRQKGGITLQLVASEDILADIARRYPHLFVVGFDAQALELGESLQSEQSSSPSTLAETLDSAKTSSISKSTKAAQISQAAQTAKLSASVKSSKLSKSTKNTDKSIKSTKANIVAAARRKMHRKKADLFVANSLHDAGSESCQLTLVTGGTAISLPRQSKQNAAAQLVGEIAAQIVSRETLQEKKTS